MPWRVGCLLFAVKVHQLPGCASCLLVLSSGALLAGWRLSQSWKARATSCGYACGTRGEMQGMQRQARSAIVAALSNRAGQQLSGIRLHPGMTVGTVDMPAPDRCMSSTALAQRLTRHKRALATCYCAHHVLARGNRGWLLRCATRTLRAASTSSAAAAAGLSPASVLRSTAAGATRDASEAACEVACEVA